MGSMNYGLWILILSTLGWFSFLDLGFSYSIQRSIVLAIEQSSEGKINRIFSTAVLLFSGIGSVAAACIIVLSLFPELLGIEKNNHETTTIALLILSLKVFWDYIMHCFKGFYNAYMRLDIDANISSLNTIIKAILIYIYIIDFNIYGAVLATMVSDIITHTIKIYYAKKIYANLKFTPRSVKLAEFKELFSYSKHVIASSFAQSLNGRVDPIIITHALGLNMVTMYSVIARLIVQIEGFVNAVAGVFHPIVTRLFARNISLDKIFNQTISINYFTAILFYCPLVVFSENFIRLWIGDEFVAAADLALALCIANLCKTVSRPVSSVLLAQANHKLISVVNLSGAVLNIIMSIISASIWGLQGIAISTALGFFISDVVLHLVLYKRYTNHEILPLLMKFFSIFILFILMTLLGKYIISQIAITTWLTLIGVGFCFQIALLMLLWPVTLHKDLRSSVIKFCLSNLPNNR